MSELATGATTFDPPTSAAPADADSINRNDLPALHGAEKRPRRAPWVDALGLAEGGLLADVAVILDLAAVYLPLLGVAFQPVVPAPFAILYLRRGLKPTLLAIAVATFLMTVLTGPHYGWRLGLMGVMGLILGWAMQRRRSPILTLAALTLLIAGASYAALIALIVLIGYPVADIVAELRNAMDSVAWLAANAAQVVGVSAWWLAVRPAYAALERFTLAYWPLLMGVYLACFALPVGALAYAVANGMARVLGHDVRPFPPRWTVRLVWWLARFVTAPLRLLRRKRYPAGKRISRGNRNE
ncbi:MAG: DUF2232 domain-containing protein [Ktedonobacterales bacterium]